MASVGGLTLPSRKWATLSPKRTLSIIHSLYTLNIRTTLKIITMWITSTLCRTSYTSGEL